MCALLLKYCVLHGNCLFLFYKVLEITKYPIFVYNCSCEMFLCMLTYLSLLILCANVTHFYHLLEEYPFLTVSSLMQVFENDQ